MEYFATTSAASRRAADCVIVGIYDRGRLGTAATDIDAASGGLLKKLLKSGDVSAQLGQCKVLNGVDGVRASRVVVVGLGKHSAFDVTKFRRAFGAALKAILQTNSRQVLNGLTLEETNGAGAYYLGRFSAETVGEALYRFTSMKSGKKSKVMPLRKVGMAVGSRGDAARASRGAEHGQAIVAGVSLAKDLGNLPANVCTPSHLARTAQKIARENKNVTARVLNETEMKRLGMHSLLSVTAGTKEPAKLIVLQYKGKAGAKPIVLVGKGVTFDSGGISLKPGPRMDEMKFDMCGAASVIGTLLTAAKLKLPLNVNVVVPAVENLPSGIATKPGDIVKSMSGKTIEILNTDAEGRLILCDALTYSRRFKPDTVIDVATLTGACVIALGHYRTAVMSTSDRLQNAIVAAGVTADDRGWPMPLGEEWTAELESNFADMANIGGREGGAIIAGCFLGKFTEGLNWAHLDIAGTAYKAGKAKGATGRPVPMLTEYLLGRCGALP
ncbi:MAG: leucyl aminopeptidase [Woeseiaceae bacterium]|nr:leucyl aminopeptidase [Woeseiaceae bacterium]NIP20048.1 leucyl aminopeptidase [Woeseiaceae bacterium]NIS88844.1 leucyl aminopeptidase [Woeseiaceae bacterium]